MDTRLNIIDSAPDGANSAGGAALGDDAREARRRERLAGLDDMASMVQFAARRLTDYIGGDLDEDEARPFASITDPCASLARLARAARQIFALQERTDDEAEARARRLADEAAGRVKAERTAQAAEEAADMAAAIAAKKRLIRQAFKEASHAQGPGEGLPMPERERLLDDLFNDYERYDDFGRDVTEIMDDLAREAELAHSRAVAEAAPDPVAANINKLLVSVERRLLHLLGETDAEEDGTDGAGSDASGSGVYGRAQGPP